MRADIADYVKTCDACQRAKQTRHLPYGELLSIPVPNAPWTAITINFIMDLPPSRNPISNAVYDCIMVALDRFSKICHYIPCRVTLDSKQFAILFIQHIFRLHGMPDSIVSNRDKLFTSHFWRCLSKALGSDHRLATAYHQQVDGLTERQNQVLEQYLRVYVNYQQDNWVSLLPLAEHAYNSSKHAVT